ncbi:hypothetical protein FACS189463_2720 [Bacteroidia bacterium]|nr:hypothetical protein FACS189463_2720 [Bacteroidia bacterium]
MNTMSAATLGISHIDYLGKEIIVRFTGIILNRCNASIPIGEELVSLQWKRTGNLIEYSVKIPKDYTVKIENFSKNQVRHCE